MCMLMIPDVKMISYVTSLLTIITASTAWLPYTTSVPEEGVAFATALSQWDAVFTLPELATSTCHFDALS